MNTCFLKTADEIRVWLDNMEINNYEIMPDLKVNVAGSVFLNSHNLDYLPVQFHFVSRNFHINQNKLTSLLGCPEKVGGSFSCSNNQIMSLKYAPKEVGNDYNMFGNQLVSLEGLPKVINGKLVVSFNQLESLEHAPEKIKGQFSCSSNKLKSLKYMPAEIGDDCLCQSNPLEDFNHFDFKCGGRIYLSILQEQHDWFYQALINSPMVSANQTENDVIFSLAFSDLKTIHKKKEFYENMLNELSPPSKIYKNQKKVKL